MVSSPARSSVRLLILAAALAALMISSCSGAAGQQSSAPTSSIPAAGTSTLPGAGRPPITVGDKNFTEQFVLGELYAKALRAQGFTVALNQSIGPTGVTIGAMQSGRVDLYPEYLQTWNTTVAGDNSNFPTVYRAFAAGQRYARAHGFDLLNPTPFSDTDAVAVTFNYAVANHLTKIADLGKVSRMLTFGAPPQFQQDPDGLPALEQAYVFSPASFKPLEIGQQYQALDQGLVQAADVNTSDGQLITGNYTLLSDPQNVFGWGNVVPVVSARVLDAEGPAFSRTVNKVSSLLTISVMRQLNAAVDLSHEDPATVAGQFLAAHGLSGSSSGAASSAQSHSGTN